MTAPLCSSLPCRVWGGGGVQVHLLSGAQGLLRLPSGQGEGRCNSQAILLQMKNCDIFSTFLSLDFVSLHPQMHVTSGAHPLRDSGYACTPPPPSPSPSSQLLAYALDCEMCYTTAGLQLTRVSVVDMELRPVFESLVKPSHPIVDYNTR